MGLRGAAFTHRDPHPGARHFKPEPLPSTDHQAFSPSQTPHDLLPLSQFHSEFLLLEPHLTMIAV